MLYWLFRVLPSLELPLAPASPLRHPPASPRHPPASLRPSQTPRPLLSQFTLKEEAIKPGSRPTPSSILSIPTAAACICLALDVDCHCRLRCMSLALDLDCRRLFIYLDLDLGRRKTSSRQQQMAAKAVVSQR